MIFSRALFLLFLVPLAGRAQMIEGSVLNGTTGRPEPGHQVILFAPSGEQARTTTNQNGAFQFPLKSSLDPHSLQILQAIHNGVEYFQAIRPGQSTNVRVYDASTRSDGVTGFLSVLQFQVKGKLLQVTELHAFNNASDPPITRVSPDNLVISVADGVKLEPAIVSGPDGGTLRIPIVPVPGEPGKYEIDYALKPGLTKYAITYQVPYNGELAFRRQAQYAMKRIGVITPDSMRFHSLGPGVFHSVVDQPGTHENVIENVAANDTFAFKLSGTGVLPRSLSPLSPGQPSRSTEVATQVQALIGAPWPHAGSPVASPTPVPVRTSRTGFVQPMTLAVSILACGILLWSLMRRRIMRM